MQTNGRTLGSARESPGTGQRINVCAYDIAWVCDHLFIFSGPSKALHQVHQRPRKWPFLSISRVLLGRPRPPYSLTDRQALKGREKARVFEGHGPSYSFS
jgi:hypothetical protein